MSTIDAGIREVEEHEALTAICEEVAKAYAKMAEYVMPQSELGARLIELAILISSGKAKITRKYVLQRYKATWANFLLRGVKEQDKRYDKLKKIHDGFDLDLEQVEFRKTILKWGNTRWRGAHKVDKVVKSLMGVLEEQIGDE